MAGKIVRVITARFDFGQAEVEHVVTALETVDLTHKI